MPPSLASHDPTHDASFRFPRATTVGRHRGMSEPTDQPAASSATDEPKRKRWDKKRIYGFVAVVVFVAGGFFLFGDSVPREVYLRFDVPPVMRSNLFEIERSRVVLVTATITDVAGAYVGTVRLPVPHGLEGPRTGPAVLNLAAGKYVVRAKVRSVDSTEVALEGLFEVGDKEIVVDLKSVR